MYDRGKILVVREGGAVSKIDGNTDTPVITKTNGVGNNHYWSTTTVLPTGDVVLTGGGGLSPADGNPNNGYNVALQASIWNSKTGV